MKLENYWVWNQLVCRLTGADCGGLDMLLIKMMQIRASNFMLMETDGTRLRDIRRLGGIVSKEIWSFGLSHEYADDRDWRWRMRVFTWNMTSVHVAIFSELDLVRKIELFRIIEASFAGCIPFLSLNQQLQSPEG